MPWRVIRSTATIIILLAWLTGCQTATTGSGPSSRMPTPTSIQPTASPELLALVEKTILSSRSSEEEARLLAVLVPKRLPPQEFEKDLKAELKTIAPIQGPELPLVDNKHVERWVELFQTRMKRRFTLYMARSGRYMHIIKPILRQYGLPEDLVYLAMIESGFSTWAYSRAHAVGPWQFIRATGRRYGLKVNAWVDERRDVVKSTHAAAAYLRDLYAEFGSWYLAAAAYNAGEAKVRRALKYHQADDFWGIAHPTRRRSYLKRETRNYVPKMVAAAMIAKNPDKYGFPPVVYDPPLVYQEVDIPRPIDLKKLAGHLGTSYTTLKELNSELRFHVTPPDGAYRLKLPRSSSLQFLAHLDQFKATPPKGFIIHVLRRGESPSTVARKYRISAQRLVMYNNIKNPRRLRAGARLKVPVRYGYAAAEEEPPSKAASNHRRASVTSRGARNRDSAETAVHHTVRSGENPWTIARKYGVSSRDLMRANGIHNQRGLKVGTRLVIPGRTAPQQTVRVESGRPKASDKSRAAKTTQPAQRRHTVRSGENLWTIAQRYGVSHRLLQQTNHIRDHRSLKIGQKLVIPTSDAAENDSSDSDRTAKSSGKSNAKTIFHVVKRGENLWDIARKYNVHYRRLMGWNKIRNHRHLKPGQRLAVHLPEDQAG